MRYTESYSVLELQYIMDEYANIDIEFTQTKGLDRQGNLHDKVMVSLGQSLHILGLGDVLYDTTTKEYFILFPVFIKHLELATGNVYTNEHRYVFQQNEIVQIELVNA